MTTEHVYERYDRTTKAAEQAEKDANELVGEFRRVADWLRDWKNVGFAGKLPNGQSVDTLEATKLIRFHEVPSIHAIFEATQKWHKCNSEVQATIQSMTEDQRRKVGLA
jgi:hypothetical protein